MEVFDIASNSTRVSFLIGSQHNPDLPQYPPPSNLAASIKNVGQVMTQDEFYNALSESVVLVGIGEPLTSVLPPWYIMPVYSDVFAQIADSL